MALLLLVTMLVFSGAAPSAIHLVPRTEQAQMVLVAEAQAEADSRSHERARAFRIEEVRDKINALTKRMCIGSVTRMLTSMSDSLNPVRSNLAYIADTLGLRDSGPTISEGDGDFVCVGRSANLTDNVSELLGAANQLNGRIDTLSAEVATAARRLRAVMEFLSNLPIGGEAVADEIVTATTTVGTTAAAVDPSSSTTHPAATQSDTPSSSNETFDATTLLRIFTTAFPHIDEDSSSNRVEELAR